ncbi:MAG: hypothetical protein P4L51_20535 [Puia sp.]|nr:hypothetical protein [Puia sp.]
MTREGEGPVLAYNQLDTEEIKIIAVTFPPSYAGKRADGSFFVPEIPERIRKFFKGVGIEIITNRLPFDEILGAEAHNREMSVLRDALALFGASVPLAIQAVLQATDAGMVDAGEHVIVATGDTALLVTASTTRLFLMKDERGLAVNEIICKPRIFDRSRKPLPPRLIASEPHGMQIEASTGNAPKE